MENKMKEVAKLIGIELEEEFRIDGYKLKYKLSNNGMMYWSNALQHWVLSNAIGKLLSGESKIIKLPKPILDDVEKEYLSAVIKPFKNKVYAIAKYDGGDDDYYIQIMLKQNLYFEYIDFPCFKKGTMYKGMELKKEYTVEQLGL